MAKTIRISEDFHAWVKAHKGDDETMEETLRRLTRGPHPEDVAGLFSPEEAAAMKDAVKRRRESDTRRKERAESAAEDAS